MTVNQSTRSRVFKTKREQTFSGANGNIPSSHTEESPSSETPGDVSRAGPKSGFTGLLFGIAALFTATGVLLGGFKAAGLLDKQKTEIPTSTPLPSATPVRTATPFAVINPKIDPVDFALLLVNQQFDDMKQYVSPRALAAHGPEALKTTYQRNQWSGLVFDFVSPILDRYNMAHREIAVAIHTNAFLSDVLFLDLFYNSDGEIDDLNLSRTAPQRIRIRPPFVHPYQFEKFQP
jgi:hypothetical protein